MCKVCIEHAALAASCATVCAPYLAHMGARALSRARRHALAAAIVCAAIVCAAAVTFTAAILLSL